MGPVLAICLMPYYFVAVMEAFLKGLAGNRNRDAQANNLNQRNQILRDRQRDREQSLN